MTSRQISTRLDLPRIAEWGLWAVGAAGFAFAFHSFLFAWSAQQQGAEELQELHARPAAARQAPTEGSIFGRLEISRIGLSAIVFEGSSQATLDKGVGHVAIQDPAGRHVVLAAHRDTFFRPLRDIQPGDAVRVTSAQGTRSYIVTGTDIVEPTATEVLRPTATPDLVLITCYPFTFVGSAPQRFIVHARLIAG